MNVHTPVSSSDELNKLLCKTRYRKTTNNNKLLKISNDGRRDAKDKRMTGVAQAQKNDEAVTLSRMRSITDKKADMNNLLTKTL